MSSGFDRRLETDPDDDQKERLEAWLTELTLISRRYRILIESSDGEVWIHDLDRQSVIGLDLTLLLDATDRVKCYDVENSILDGVWLVDTPQGPQEQRAVGRVWPRRNGGMP